MCRVCDRGGELRACDKCDRRFHHPRCDGYTTRGRLLCEPCYRRPVAAVLDRALKSLGELRVRIVDGAGEPVPHARVRAARAIFDSPSSGGVALDTYLSREEPLRWTTAGSGLIATDLRFLPDPFVILAETTTRRAWRVVSFAELSSRPLELVLNRTFQLECRRGFCRAELQVTGARIHFAAAYTLLWRARFARLLPGEYLLRATIGAWTVARRVAIVDRDVVVDPPIAPRGAAITIASKTLRPADRLYLFPGVPDLGTGLPDATLTSPLVAAVAVELDGAAHISDVPRGTWTAVVASGRGKIKHQRLIHCAGETTQTIDLDA